MSTKTIEIIKDINALKSIWNKTLKQTSIDNVFSTYEWLSCWLKIYVNNIEQFIICIKENDTIIGIAPFIIVNHREFGIPLKRLQFIGYRSCDYLDFIITKDREECLKLFFNYINENSQKWDYCELLHILGESDNMVYLRNTLSDMKQLFKLFKDSVSPYIKIQSDIETFLKQKKAGLRYDLKKGEREINNLGKLTYSKICTQREALNELPLFFEMLYKREAFVERKGDEESKIKLQEIFQLFIEDNQMWRNINFCKLAVENKNIAYHFGFEYNKKIYWYKPTFDIEFLKQSPGKLLIKKTMEYAIIMGYNELDLLLGDEPYKFQWTSTIRESYDLIYSNKKIFSKILFYWFIMIRPYLKNLKNLISKNRA